MLFTLQANHNRSPTVMITKRGRVMIISDEELMMICGGDSAGDDDSL